jgi:2-hydroxy-3-oxopropionate reductase
MKVGFIGLGIMGKPMAKNMIKAGYDLIVFDLNKASVMEVVSAGADEANSIRELSAASEVIITMLPNSPQVKAVVLGEGGVIETAKAGTVLIDMSSIAPLASKEIAKELEQKGIDMLDAPVSGGEPKAIDGTLSIMVGGKAETFERFKPMLLKMGASVVLCGTLGAGNVTKLANQIIVAVNIAAMSEAFVLAQKAGVSIETVFNAIKGGLAGSTVLNAKAPMILEGNYNPGFKIDLHIKDLNNALDTAKELDSPAFLTHQVMDMLQTLHNHGEGQSDHSAIFKFYEKFIKGELKDEQF